MKNNQEYLCYSSIIYAILECNVYRWLVDLFHILMAVKEDTTMLIILR